MILSVDVGTTNLKVGIYTYDGKMIFQSAIPTKYNKHPSGFTYIDPELLSEQLFSLIKGVTSQVPEVKIRAISITSMAESGVLINPDSGKTVSEIIPWFDPSSIEQTKFIESQINNLEQFFHTGLHISYKYGLPKLIWLKNREPSIFNQPVVWLSVSSFIAFRLTGRIVEERTLAARTFVYRIDKKEWNYDLIEHFGLSREMFPPVIHCLEPVGIVKGEYSLSSDNEGIHVYLAGHDHICSSIATGTINPGSVYNSMGTAETLVGTFQRRELTKEDYESGLSFGLNHHDDLYYWMGGHSSSGGAVEWIREILAEQQPISYEKIIEYLEESNNQPSTVLFFPYLNGCGAPSPNPDAKASFIGLTRKTTRQDLVKAVIEGNAYQMELIRDKAEKITQKKISKMTIVGGGTRNPYWLKIKANISGNELLIPKISEAGLCGAAIIAATAEGIFHDFEEAVSNCIMDQTVIYPDMNQYKLYRNIYINCFKPVYEVIGNYSVD